MKQLIQIFVVVLLALLLRTVGLPAGIGAAIEPAATAVIVLEPVTVDYPRPVAAPGGVGETAVSLPPHLHPTQPTTGGDYRAWQGELRYCWFGGWSDADRQTMLQAFAVWQPAGVRFVAAEGVADCTLALIAENNGENGNAGYASMGPGMWRRLPGRITVNSHYPLTQAAAVHETGHVLGLLHWSAGVMAEDYWNYGLPGPAEFAAVRSMWGVQ